MTNLKEIIYKRKSTRKYDMTPLDAKTLADIQNFVAKAKPLYNGIKVEFEIIDGNNIKGMFAIKAPHYMIIRSETEENYLVNAGFMLQQADLYLQSMGFGSCWLGMAKPAEKSENNLEYVIMLAFGKPLGSPHRDLSGFKRKPLSQISDISDHRLEPARLAPSGINSQPWFFVSYNNIIHVYCVKHGAVKNLIYKRLNKIDMGIALAHLFLVCERFKFFAVQSPMYVKGHYYIGSVEL